MSVRHFLSLLDYSQADYRRILARAEALKKAYDAGIRPATLRQRVLGMIFEKASTRTRLSFEAGIAQLGGTAIFLSPRDTQLGRGEPIEDSARVISRMVDAVMIRAKDHHMVEQFAAYSRVPVINALTDLNHPCQLLADVFAFEQNRGSIQGKRVAWIGDGFNMCHSYINAAQVFDFELMIATPEGYQPDPAVVAAAGDRVHIVRTAHEAASGADLVVTDVWASMGQEDERERRLRDFKTFVIDDDVMARAHSDALFMHCLPAHRGEEVTAEVIDGPQSVVWQEAEARLHTQKALLEFLILGDVSDDVGNPAA
ncbi:MAG: ornithine carbamoyltransferase [Halothiobacillus sp. 14-56-357]|jgi:ornithine carbamoyltransferase|uniref:ornithine carbamoyltransferase n=1 Tax=Halothiobacillus sp. 15-55-196 TaxID=1970382 RepID=UPI000BCA8E1A|nr:ornithine carbamoyltransferase [Halothiobacillus sp. 15-55-196]OZB37480.1 MAG: ornithine carbamoyltransferase [Halothiobacillus sp. 15-55-196]OZB57695.1 MAG: ornithine carbamoyltransferase [Halothiobacillus sp. 14-56-357]OZB79520.1 MAG: ornithine carbamoyltransferase [Halothiobacillus sp. 13-55-115]